MAPKRKRVSYDDDALIRWVRHTSEMRKRASREGARNGSHPSGKLILDAHEWGEAMVRAYLASMADDGVAASDRWNALRGKGREWYARGYLFYLLPQCAGAPEALLHTCYEHVYNRPPPSKAVRVHGSKGSGSLVGKLRRHNPGRCVGCLQDASAATRSVPQPPPLRRRRRRRRRPHRPRLHFTSASLAPSPMTVSPATAIVAKSRQGLPSMLARLLKNPASKEPRTLRRHSRACGRGTAFQSHAARME